jgi:IS4 transposase
VKTRSKIDRLREGIDAVLEMVSVSKMTKTTKPVTAAAAKQQSAMEALRALVGPEEIIEAGCRLGVIQRQRKVDLPSLVEATILSVLPLPGVQTTVFANYMELTGAMLAPSSFYDRFSMPFAELMRELSERAMKAVHEATPENRRCRDFGILLKEFSDVQVADSTSVLLRKLARHWAPSTSKKKPAGVKWHTVISLKDGVPFAERLTEQRLHDSVGLPDGALAPGTLTLFDLGYLDVTRFIDAIERGAHFLTRLKTNHNPIIARVYEGKGDRVKVRGMRLDEALEQGLLLDEAGALDLDVRLETGERSAIARVVAELAPDGEFHWYLTSVGRDILTVDDVVEAYRLRWAVELYFKQLKSGLGLETIQASRPSAVAALIYTKLIALCLARLLELSIEEKEGRRATTQLALVLALTRCAPLLFADSLIRRGVTLAQLEERLMLVATVVARSRNQRRERARRKREASIGTAT